MKTLRAVVLERGEVRYQMKGGHQGDSDMGKTRNKGLRKVTITLSRRAMTRDKIKVLRLFKR